MELRSIFGGPTASSLRALNSLFHAILRTPPCPGFAPRLCFDIVVFHLANLDRPAAREAVLLALNPSALAILLQPRRGDAYDSPVRVHRAQGVLEFRQVEIFERFPVMRDPPVRHLLDDERVPGQIMQARGALGRDNGLGNATGNKEKTEARRHELLRERSGGHVGFPGVCQASLRHPAKGGP